MQIHDYSVFNHDRAKVGRYLGATAAVISTGMSAAAVVLIGWAQALGLSGTWLQAIIFPVSSVVIYAAVYWLFNVWAWRQPVLGTALNILDLQGIWKVDGKSLAPDGSVRFSWEAEIVLTQFWDKIHVELRTNQSTSSSLTAALLRQPGGGWRLIYAYSNRVKISEPNLHDHLGYCEVAFSADGTTGEAEYFTNPKRASFGVMAWTKVSGR